MDKRELIDKCAEMFEKYYDSLAGKNERHTVYSLNAEDMKLWKETYYVELQKYEDIQDGGFFNRLLRGKTRIMELEETGNSCCMSIAI